MKRITTYVAVCLLLFGACKKKQAEIVDSGIHLTEINKEQFQAEDMLFDTPKQMIFEKSIQFTGKIEPEIDGIAQLSSSIDGIIEKILVQSGQFVNAGDVIMEVGGNPFIELQQAYAMSSAKMKQLKAQFERTEALFKDNIKTENEFLLAESAYKSELANSSALKIKLHDIGLKTEAIENGFYASTFKIRTPIQGQLSNMNVRRGQYIYPQLLIAEIVNVDKNQLQLSIFERDYNKIKIGQKVLFNTTGDADTQYLATITRVSKVLNTQSKSFECFAEIMPSIKSTFIIHQLVRGDIIFESDTVLAVPQEAILKAGESSFVYVKEQEDETRYFLSQFNVKTGRKSKGFVELIDGPMDKSILVSGTYHMSVE